MSYESIRIFPLGDSAMTVEFGIGISRVLNEKAINFAAHFDRHRFPGFIEVVPAYASATIFYDITAVREYFPQFPTAFAAVKSLAVAAINDRVDPPFTTGQVVDIPVRFDKASALDLGHIADRSGFSREKVIEIFTAVTYRVFMLGFLPGFSYMGEVDNRIAAPRRESPRLKVPKGSVGIAGNQAGIYSLESPGGWQIIGRTTVEMFTPKAATLSRLAPGDNVRFFAA